MVLIVTSFLALSVATVEVRSADSTSTKSTTTTKKIGVGGEAKKVGGDIKEGTETVFKDLGKGVKKIGEGIDVGAKDTVKGAEKVGSSTKKTVSKVTHHKKADKATTTSETATTTESKQ